MKANSISTVCFTRRVIVMVGWQRVGRDTVLQAVQLRQEVLLALRFSVKL